MLNFHILLGVGNFVKSGVISSKFDSEIAV